MVHKIHYIFHDFALLRQSFVFAIYALLAANFVAGEKTFRTFLLVPAPTYGTIVFCVVIYGGIIFCEAFFWCGILWKRILWQTIFSCQL